MDNYEKRRHRGDAYGKRKKITSQACGLVYLVLYDFIRDRQRD